MPKISLLQQLEKTYQGVRTARAYCDEKDYKDSCMKCAYDVTCTTPHCLHKAYRDCEKIIKKMKSIPNYNHIFH